MHFGLNLPNGGPAADPRSLAELAQLAEASGWEGVFLEDYLVYQNKIGTPTYDPWVSLAAMAMRTERIRLGTTVTPIVRRRVAKLAAETITIDHLSRGRLTLGVGLGDQWDVSLAAFGDAPDLATRARIVDESLEALVGLWAGGPFSVHGQHIHIDQVTMMPQPVQQPRIPIWIGGQYPKPGPIRRAARWDGSCLFKAAQYSADKIVQAEWTPDDIRDLRAQIGPHGDISVGGRARADDWPADRALAQSLAEAGATWWIEWIPPADFDTMRTAIAHGPLRP
ncbi:MAG TPA: LLM class flavin-dependent oxidoreductase [Chloroflexota bacterium]|jgi:alkanesulfonate monooxygenase SsuD/methylene tetrahydromethanopterin reductase-like flavin-dependent oxidoreductase (luciferase family)